MGAGMQAYLCPYLGIPASVLRRTSARGRAYLRPLLPNCRTNPRQIAERFHAKLPNKIVPNCRIYEKYLIFAL